MSIYFPPTFLYIKKHNITGLKYFGRTTSDDPISYQGSGNYWRRHLKKHGDDVSTLWYYLYTDKETIQEEALAFSQSHDIVNSVEWANLMPEDGINGSVSGRIMGPPSQETRKKISDALKLRNKNIPPIRKPHSDQTKEKIRAAIKSKGPRSEELKLKLSKANKGKKLSTEIKQKISQSLKGRKCPKTAEHRQKLSDANKGKKLSTEIKQKISQSLKGRKWPIRTCEHCGTSAPIGNYVRWHGDNCKNLIGEKPISRK